MVTLKFLSTEPKDAKNKKIQRVHLVKYAVPLLLERKKNETNPKAIWVFPSDNSRSGHITGPECAWKNICKAAGIEDLTLHDLRRTHGSWMRKAGADREIIGEALGHKDLKSTGIYDIIEPSQTVKYKEQAINDLMTETSQIEIKKITDNIEPNNTIEILQSQIKAQQKMIEELIQQIREVKYT